MSDEMSAEPVAEVDAYSEGFEDAMKRLQEYVEQARAMAIAECARVAKERTHKAFATDDAFMEGRYDAASEIEAAIRALSSPPIVSEEWVEKIAIEYSPTFSGIAMDAIKAALAALGVQIKEK